MIFNAVSRLHLISNFGTAFSLWLIHLTALTVHRTVIHYRSDAFSYLKGKPKYL